MLSKMCDAVMDELTKERFSEFQKCIFDWWSENKRELPWRDKPTPYNVLISEVMLQQTQVSRVIAKFHEFLENFPDIESLANADTKHLLQVWRGLGYNRRALWLREAAQQIAERDSFPATQEDLRELKGIGPYTSRSILIFAFNQDLAAVDTNIRRVLIAEGFADEEMSENELQSIAEKLLPKGRSTDWHNALMDYGSAVLTSSKTGIQPKSTQTKFKGSSRHLRGEILKVLTSSDIITKENLIDLVDFDNLQEVSFDEVLEQLIDEGFIQCTDSGCFRISE